MSDTLERLQDQVYDALFLPGDFRREDLVALVHAIYAPEIHRLEAALNSAMDEANYLRRENERLRAQR